MNEVSSLYKIRDSALSNGRAVYNTSQLAHLINKDRNVAAVYLSRLVQKKLAIRLIRGKISFVEDDFVIASQLVEPSYISLDSALLFHNVIQQVPRYVQSVTPVNSILYHELGLEYHKINPGLMFGFERHKVSGSYCFVATREKALLDGYYLKLFTLDDVLELGRTSEYKKLRPLFLKFIGKGKKKMLEVFQ